MIERNQVYKCELCGNLVEVVDAGGGTLVCCGQDMKHLAENTTDAATEKHVPVIEKVDGGYKVSVGSVDHPMEEKHYIQWIELVAGDDVHRKHLAPGDRPEASFAVEAGNVAARAYCNLHGLWMRTNAMGEMTLDRAIQTALEYEHKIHDLYREAMDKASDETGRRIFGTMADEEQGHVDHLMVCFDEWERTGKVHSAELATVIPDAETLEAGLKTLDKQMEGRDWSNELALLDRALKAETETRQFYQRMVAELDEEGQKLFQRILEIEDAHYDLVQAEIDALTGNSFWLDFMELRPER